MVKAGIETPDYPNAAHHIVAGSSPKATEARAILQKYGVDINDAANGVFLPTQKGVSNSAYHPSLNTNAYYDKVNKDAIKEMISKLNSNKALKNEMYISIMNEKFPEKCWAKVKGFTAREYLQNLGIDINITYMKMIEML